VIQLRDFETLTLLYKIDALDAVVKQLAFSGDGFRVVDIRDTKTKIWEPSALIRKVNEEDSSVSDNVSIPAQVVGSEESIEITALIAHATQDLVIVGKVDGTVAVYNSNGLQTTSLYSHTKDVYVTSLAYSESAGIIASADVSSTVVAWTIKDSGSNELVTETQILNEHCDQPIRQLVLSRDGTRLLISTATHDVLWKRSADGTFTIGSSIHLSASKMWKWIELPNSDGVLLVTESGSDLSSWTALDETQLQPISLTFDAGNEPQLNDDVEMKALAIDVSGRFLVVDVAKTLDRNVTDHLAVYIIDDINSSYTQEPNQTTDEAGKDDKHGKPGAVHANSPPPPPSRQAYFRLASKDIKYFISIIESKLVFLDNNLCVCSIDLRPRSLSTGSTLLAQEELPVSTTTITPVVNRHFFIPLEYIGGNNGVTATVLANGDVVFPKEGEVVVVKGGLKWSQGTKS
jgi:hypothetical protein